MVEKEVNQKETSPGVSCRSTVRFCLPQPRHAMLPLVVTCTVHQSSPSYVHLCPCVTHIIMPDPHLTFHENAQCRQATYFAQHFTVQL